MGKLESQTQSVKMLHPLVEAKIRKQSINPCSLKRECLIFENQNIIRKGHHFFHNSTLEYQGEVRRVIHLIFM